MENDVLIISVYFFIAFIVAITIYALDKEDHSSFEDMTFYSTLSIVVGLLWGAFALASPIYLVFKFIDKYVRD